MPIDTGTTSIHVTSDDKDIFEKYNLEDKGIGNAYHTAAEEMDEYRELKAEVSSKLNKFYEGKINIGQLLKVIESIEPEEE